MKLLGRTGQVAGRDINISSQLKIGAADDNDFRVVVRGVSRHHARIVRDGVQYFIEDSGSTNGTFLNGQRIMRERLEHLDVITLGRDVDLIAVAAGEPGTGSGVPVRTITDVAIEWLDGPETGARVEVLPGELTLGRLAPSNIVIENPVVSQLHARIVRALDHVAIHDMESANGTYVNAQRITEPAVLRNGDVVSIAGVRQFRMRVSGDTTRAVPQNIAMSQSMSIPAAVRDWQTRLVWSADELAQLESARSQAINIAKNVSSDSALIKSAVRVAPPAPVVVAKEPPAPAPVAKEPASLPPQSLPPQPPPPLPPPPPPAPVSVANEPASIPPDSNPSLSLSVANQPPGPKSVIPYVPQAGSMEFREADTKPIPPTVEPQTTHTQQTIALIFRGIKLSGSTGEFQLGLGAHLIGRADDAGLQIRTPQVSRHHALLTVTDKGATIADKKSANGTFLNMQRVQTDPVALATGDIVSFGSVEFSVELLA
jgi:pSer/pThr/pTyr-binding forkhead associated (FHA) protein